MRVAQQRREGELVRLRVDPSEYEGGNLQISVQHSTVKRGGTSLGFLPHSSVSVLGSQLGSGFLHVGHFQYRYHDWPLCRHSSYQLFWGLEILL